jgi:nucleoside-diphosphate-sugar epimerase
LEKVLVVGKNSFIGKNIYCDKVSYVESENVNFSNYDVVINCALHPEFKTSTYAETIDIDYEIGNKACNNGCHYVMLSTSKVYGNCNHLKTYDESSELYPYDYYGENKLQSEIKLFSDFGDKVTVLRGSNIFGFEYGRNSFVGYCMTQLVNEGKIVYTISEKTKRDFLFIKDAVNIIEKVCEKKPVGVYNLSSNCGLEIGIVAKNIIKGYKYGGKFKASGPVERQFIMNNNKLMTALNLNYEFDDWENIFMKLGKELCKI